MVKLIAKSPCDGLPPINLDGLVVREVLPETITCVAAFNGQEDKVSEALKSQIGAELPKPGRFTGRAGNRVVWSGLGQFLVLGPAVRVAGAAVTDQSDAWAGVSLAGDIARDVLARLTPLDLRESHFKRGHVARSLLGHMHGLFLHTGADRFEVFVFRSMAHTMVREIAHAAQSVRGQADLG